MNLIAAADENWGIGRKGRLLVSIPLDRKFFREMTMGKVTVMGRRTFESLKNEFVLSGRTNIVLSTKNTLKTGNAILLHSMPEALEELKKYSDEDIFIIGGASIYSQFLPFCNAAYITKIHKKFDADTFLTDLDILPEWKITEEGDEQTYFDLEYHFLKYERVS